MEWRDEAIILSVRRHGENAAVLSVLTRTHGRYGGLVRGGQSRRLKGVLQPGNRIAGQWRARLEEHLGTMTVEPVTSHAAALMMDAGRLAALSSALAVVEAGLPEREANAEVFDDLAALLVALEGENWAETYVRWEVGVLADLGFGLDLSSCAATGVTEDLVYVSPRTGRAVSREAGRPYQERLLPLPAFLVLPPAVWPQGDREQGDGDLGAREQAGADALYDGLALTGRFLTRHIFDLHGRPPPDARARLMERFRREAAA